MPAVSRRFWFLSPLLMAAVIALPLGAQGPVTASLTATVQVIAPVSITVTHVLDFGRVLTSSNKTVAPNASNSGRLELIGNGGSSVAVSMVMPSELKPASGPGLTISGWNYIVSDSPSLSGTPVSFAAGGVVPFSATFPAGGGNTKVYFGVGATIVTSASQATGIYTGTAQFEAAYSDL